MIAIVTEYEITGIKEMVISGELVFRGTVGGRRRVDKGGQGFERKKCVGWRDV